MLERFHQLKQGDNDTRLLDTYHTLMRAYGYIPLDEFKKMPIPLVAELLDRIEKEFKVR